MSASRDEVPVFCGKDCGGDACPLLAEREGGRIIGLRPNPASGPFLKACGKGLSLAREHYSPRRLRSPLLRTGPRGSGSFREAGWDEALGLVASRLGEIIAKKGSSSILALASAGSTGALHDSIALTRRFLSLFGGGTGLSGSYSNGAARFVLPYVLGPEWKRSGFDPATLRYAKFIVLWGANILDTRLGSELPARLLEARARGARIIAIDPRRTSTVRRAATDWLPVRPGSDAALMLALLQVMVSEDLVDRPFVEARALGFDRLERYVMGLEGEGGPALPRDPEWAAPICGLSPGAIRDLARAWAAAKPAMLLPGYSIQRVAAGEEPFRLAVALQLASGSFGARGGSTGSLNNRLPTPRVGTISPIAPGGIAGVQLPILQWPDAILGGRRAGFPSDIAAAYVAGGNFANQGADAVKSVAAMRALEFSVCHEMFLTPTAALCDVVLPVASSLEKSDIGLPWLGNYLLYKTRAAPFEGLARTDFAIFGELAERMGALSAYSEGKGEAAWLEAFIADSEIPDPAAFKAGGIYLAPEQERVGLSDFSADPARHPLGTPSGKVELASEAYARETGGGAIPTWRGREPDPLFPLSLVSPKRADRTHSQGGFSSGAAYVERTAPAMRELEMNPADAAARGITEGDTLRVKNARGATRARARLTDDIMPGVVSLAEGAWLEPDGSGEDQAGSPNVLTSTEGGGPARSAVMHAIAVNVERI